MSVAHIFLIAGRNTVTQYGRLLTKNALTTDAIQEVTSNANTVEQAVSISFNCIEKSSVYHPARSHPPPKPLVKQRSNYRLHLSLKEPEGILKSAHSKSSIKCTGKSSPKKKKPYSFVFSALEGLSWKQQHQQDTAL